MQNDTLNTSTPPYIAYYGMVRDPFSQAIENDLFYAEPNRKQRLDILLHLAQFGNELMMVIGPKGSGKTTLLQQFQAKALDTWKIARIEAEGGIDERKLLQQLYHQMGMEYQGATHAELLERMEHHLDSLQRSARLGIMIIDNADQLPITALKKVLEMAALTNTENKPLLRIILFGTESLEEHFKDPQLGHSASSPRRSMDLPPFSEEHTTHYILHRLSAAHFAANKPFTDNAILRIYRQSFGWPARINELAHDLLINSIPKKEQESAPGFDLKTFRPARLVASLSVIVAIAGLLIFQNDINQWINPDKSTVAENAEKIPLAIPEPEPKTEDKAESMVTKSVVSAEPPSASTITNMPDISVNTEAETGPKTELIATSPTTTLAQKERIEKTSIQPVSNKAANDVKEITKPEAPKQQTSVSKTIAPKTVSTSIPSEIKKLEPQQSAGDDLNISHKEAWILKQNPGHFTMQVVAGENISTIEKFIFENKLKDNIAFYRSTRRDKVWYGLIYGIYPNKQAAIDARERLPKKLRQLKPWIRDIKGVHQDIRKARP